MAYKRLLVSLLLITISLLVFTQKVNSQNFTTVTSMNTITNYVTDTQTSVSITGTASATTTSKATMFISSFTLSGVTARYCNVEFYGPLIFNAEQTIVGTLTARAESPETAQSINFYIMNDNQLSNIGYTQEHTFQIPLDKFGMRFCPPSYFSFFIGAPLNYQQNDADIPFQWTTPSTGNYYFVFVSLNPNDATVALQVSRNVTSVTSYVLFVTLSSINAKTMTETFTTTATSQIGQPPLTQTGIMALVPIIIAVIVGTLLWRKRRHGSEHDALEA
jgi:hypothetical protein